MKNNQILKTLKKINFKALIIGFLTYQVLSFVFAITAALITVLIEKYTANAIQFADSDLSIIIMLVVFTTIILVLTGYLTGIISKTNIKLNTITIGSLIILYSLVSIKESSVSLYFIIFGTIITIPAILIGGILAEKYLQKKLLKLKNRE